MIMLFATFVLVFAIGAPASAQIIEDPVAAARSYLEESCGTVKYVFDWLQYDDLTGDGLDDLVITHSVLCDGAASMFFGTAGCSGGVYVQRPDGRWQDARLQPNVSRTQWQGRVAITFWQHGSVCGRVGADSCISTRVWNGIKFEIVEKNY
jgi:hypothetical protein